MANLGWVNGRPLPARIRAALDERTWCPRWYGVDVPPPGDFPDPLAVRKPTRR